MTQGLEEVRRMVQEYRSNLALVVNHSGEKDSTRTLGFVRKKFPETPTYFGDGGHRIRACIPNLCRRFCTSAVRRVRFSLERRAQPEAHVLGDGRASWHVSVAAVSPMHVRSEARAYRQIHPEPTAQGDR